MQVQQRLQHFVSVILELGVQMLHQCSVLNTISLVPVQEIPNWYTCNGIWTSAFSVNFALNSDIWLHFRKSAWLIQMIEQLCVVLINFPDEICFAFFQLINKIAYIYQIQCDVLKCVVKWVS